MVFADRMSLDVEYYNCAVLTEIIYNHYGIKLGTIGT